MVNGNYWIVKAYYKKYKALIQYNRNNMNQKNSSKNI